MNTPLHCPQIMREDGKSGVRRGNVFVPDNDFPGAVNSVTGKICVDPVDVVLTNPPFGGGGEQELYKFVNKGLSALKPGGLFVSVVMDSLVTGQVRARRFLLLKWLCLAPTACTLFYEPRF